MCAGPVHRFLAEIIVASAKTYCSIRISYSNARDRESLCIWRGWHFGERQVPIFSFFMHTPRRSNLARLNQSYEFTFSDPYSILAEDTASITLRERKSGLELSLFIAG